MMKPYALQKISKNHRAGLLNRIHVQNCSILLSPIFLVTGTNQSFTKFLF